MRFLLFINNELYLLTKLPKLANCITKAEKASYILTKYLKLKLFSRRIKVHLYAV